MAKILKIPLEWCHGCYTKRMLNKNTGLCNACYPKPLTDDEKAMACIAAFSPLANLARERETIRKWKECGDEAR